MMLLEELGNLSALVRMPVPQHAPNTMGVCLLSDFPTTVASLGAARVVVNLNARVDADEIESLSTFSISRDGLKIAYTILYQQGHVAVEVKDVASDEAGTLLTEVGGVCMGGIAGILPDWYIGKVCNLACPLPPPAARLRIFGMDA